MKSGPTLIGYLDRYSEAGPRNLSVASAIDAIASASVDIADLIGHGALAGITGATQGINADGDLQKDLDIRADELLRNALGRVRVAALASEEAAEAELRDPSAAICIALDPLDGSSSIEANMTIGTIFSITATPRDLNRIFRQGGAAQLAAGFVVYGPQTSLVLTVGDGVDIFTLDRNDKSFKLIREKVRIPADTPEYAINASNVRHWEPPVRAFIDECLAGSDGPRSKDFNMRWLGSLVAETYRILARGGVFLYPADARASYREGRLRLVYEAHPIAFIVEQAGGAATTGRERILDLVPDSLHQRVPLIMGSIEMVRRLERLHLDPGVPPEMTAPLFAHRGFFRVQN
jgi:fructose-1,6-bisphosphatase I